MHFDETIRALSGDCVLVKSNDNSALSGVSKKTRAGFAAFIRSRRLELGISTNELERRTGIHQSRLSRWENGIDTPSRVDRLTTLAKGLEIPAADLYVIAGIELSAELPSMRPYLRSKYGQALPAEALKEIEVYGQQVAARYGISTGPGPGEDE